ncbi:MAG: 3-deoxy-manno-octulosonate cytidylyltransferase [Gammaproteobacteria bacterium]|nr:3-deoxy-manno-octulosonate cytidylyltransferase [Gammaproteobacteria bacterium]
MTFRVIIPARYAATRLPGKPLVDICGKPMIQHVYERALESGADQVVIATDSAQIEAAVKEFGGDVCLTAATHQSGTDRIAEVADKLGFAEEDIIVNLQGDEPLMPPAVIRQVADNLAQTSLASMSTVCARINTAAELFDPHLVKVVKDKNDFALYFSRASIPWDRDAFASTTEVLPEDSEHFRHIGIYAYRSGFLQQYTRWPACALEKMESLEQLRALWNGHRIHVAEAVEVPLAGVDTDKDLAMVRAHLSA